MTQDADSVVDEFCEDAARENAVWMLRHPNTVAVYSLAAGAESVFPLWLSRGRAKRYLDAHLRALAEETSE